MQAVYSFTDDPCASFVASCLSLTCPKCGVTTRAERDLIARHCAFCGLFLQEEAHRLLNKMSQLDQETSRKRRSGTRTAAWEAQYLSV